jgi:tetratricopeptide (TPR) repeat protein
MEIESNKQALQFKEKGNAEFKKGNFIAAIEQYTKAIEIDSSDASFYANRAACFLSAKKYNKCIEDCNKTLALDPNFVKALRRRAKSNMLLGNLNAALNDYNQA